MFKQKRAFLGEGATNTPAGATNQNVSATTPATQENVQPMQFGPQAEEILLNISVE